MSVSENSQQIYEELMDKIKSNSEIKEKFDSRTQSGLLDKDYAHEVLIDWSDLLNYDLSDAITYFDLDNPDIPPEEIRQHLDFDSFINLVDKWLQKQLLQTSPKQKQSTNQDQYWFKSEPGTLNTEQSDLKHQEQLIKAIFESQESKTKKVFNEYAMMNDQNDTISKQDFPLLLKNLLYQHNASIYEKGGQEDYFMRSNSYGNLNNFLKDDQINYQQFKEAAIQFIKGNQDLILLDNEQINKKKEKQQPQVQPNLEEELLQQIDKYQQILQTTEPEIEKQVLRNMITTLVRQLDLIRDNTMRLDETQINSSMKPKANLQVSFSGIVRPEKRTKTKEEIEIEKRDHQILEIFLFFAKQQYVNGVAYEFDRYSKEAQSLSLGMFLYFCKCFNLIETHVRKPNEENLLERKKRGEDVNITRLNQTIINKSVQEEEKQVEQVSTIISPKQKPPTVPVDIQKVENLPRRNKYSHVPSKFEWWNDELKFDKYYNPNQNPLPQQILDDMKYLTKDEIKSLFKRSAFGKDLDFEEFKCLLGFMANLMFKQNGERHPHAYQLILRLMYIDYPEEYRKRLIPIKIPFNCKEKIGFRQLPGYEHHEYKGRQLSQQEKQQLQKLKQERENQLRERLTENPNQSIRSIGSINSQSITNLPYNKQQGRFLNGRIDLDREKVSWAKLENLNPNDLSGHGRNFKPQDLIDEFEDEEDRFFLKEFSLEEDKKNQLKPEEVQKNLEKYGAYKPPKRPTQKHQMSQPQLLNQRYDQKSVDMKNQYLQRANQIQQLQNKKEQQLLQKINKQYKI
ncbi:unnamed protein product [Paramecium pentaurelia]|uniref:Uncharacterized protein n=1 Tax=Paramecium pentaurelia TaxID=43138 RepID=A0A8S1WN94_9CILI|nr:unnamed protein product [Paramecium pentaurelia]